MNGSLLILASSSPRRRDLLSEARFVFEVLPAAVEEIAPPDMEPAGIVQYNARLKCRAVAAGRREGVVLGVDTLVAFGGTVLGKPRDMQEAENMLERLNGQTHEVYSGVALCLVEDHREAEFVTVSRVTFHVRDSETRRRYLERIQPLDKAGAYAAQEDSGVLIESISGSRTNVIGLPMEDLVPRLAGFGVFPSP